MQRYAITDRSLLPPHALGMEAAMCEQVRRWVHAGVEWVQLREKDLREEVLASLVSCLLPVIRAPGSRTRILVNLACASGALQAEQVLAWGANGVHMAGGACAETVQRAATAAKACDVSVSCHTLADVQAAGNGGAALALWSPVFGKSIQGREVLAGTGLAQLEAACIQAAPMPLFALGGVSSANAAACVDAGAAGIAGIRLFHD